MRSRIDKLAVAGERTAIGADDGRRLDSGRGPAHKQVFNVNAWDNEANPGVRGQTVVDDHRRPVRMSRRAGAHGYLDPRARG
jgi:hypothetical protein